MLLQNLFGCSVLLDFSSAVLSSAPSRRVESLVLERDSWAKESLQAGRKFLYPLPTSCLSPPTPILRVPDASFLRSECLGEMKTRS